MINKVKPPPVDENAREGARYILLLLRIDPEEGRAAIEKICAAAHAWSASASNMKDGGSNGSTGL